MNTNFIKNMSDRHRNSIIRDLCSNNAQSLKSGLMDDCNRILQYSQNRTHAGNFYQIRIHLDRIHLERCKLSRVMIEYGEYGTSVVAEYRGMEKIFISILAIHINITMIKLLDKSSRKLRKRLRYLNEDLNKLKHTTRSFTTSPIPGNKYLSKIDKAIEGVNALKTDKDKRILVFANCPHIFEQIKNAFKIAKTKFIEFKGNSNTITKRIRDYNSGKEPIMLLNAKFFASGINLPNTTDIFIIQNLDKYTIKQIIGRAKRIGKEDCKSLTVHTILYNIEKQIVFRDDKAEEK